MLITLFLACFLVYGESNLEDLVHQKNELVLVPGGSFDMGRSFFGNNEGGVPRVTLSDFYIGKFEITQQQWQDVMGSNPSDFVEAKLPVEQVSWYDAIEFCNRLSEREELTPVYTINKNRQDPINNSSGDNLKWTVTANWNANGYRLPTEAEWEFAARGGNESLDFIYSGANAVWEVAWYNDNSGLKTHPVGTKKANELGIHDMSGNVLEWCWDGYDTYTRGNITDPRGPKIYSGAVLRGGCYSASDVNCNVIYRDWAMRSFLSSFIGFRVVRSAL